MAMRCFKSSAKVASKNENPNFLRKKMIVDEKKSQLSQISVLEMRDIFLYEKREQKVNNNNYIYYIIKFFSGMSVSESQLRFETIETCGDKGLETIEMVLQIL